MSGESSQYTTRATESPLDLTVKRFDMEDPSDAMHTIHDYEYGGYSTYSSTVNIPMNTEYSYEHYPQTSAPEVDYQYGNNYCSNVVYSQDQGYQSTSIPVPSSSFTNHTGSYTTAMIGPEDQDSLESYPSSGTQSYSPPCESSIIPKKRKNLWRPYDSKLIQMNDAEEKESDSGSDSMSGSPSDQESKNRSPLPDLAKKRKIHRPHQHYKLFSADDNQMKSGYIEREQDAIRRNSEGTCNGINAPSTSTAYSTPSVSASKSEVLAEPTTVLKATDPAQAVEHRDKMISGMKKRDIFGWSLKLKDPAVSEDATADTEISISSLKEEERVCKDGEKTYIELQTVKKSTSDAVQQDNVNAEMNVNRSQPAQKESNLIKSENIKRKHNDTTKPDTKVDKSETDKDDSNYVGKKVYIQHRDNVVECCNESDVKERGKTQTKKGISLIDLIEEIEASAKHQDKDEIEKTNRRNRNVAKLLDQCNYVKLRALDFLMANVLIQDKQSQIKPKNEKVQKMLKGDKINSVSMLDVVELQVEMGLN